MRSKFSFSETNTTGSSVTETPVVFAVSADNSTCVNRTLQWRWLETQKFSKASVIDLQKKETARASMRKMVKHLLKKFKYPPVEYDTAISTVISQCEM